MMNREDGERGEGEREEGERWVYRHRGKRRNKQTIEFHS